MSTGEKPRNYSKDADFVIENSDFNLRDAVIDNTRADIERKKNAPWIAAEYALLILIVLLIIAIVQLDSGWMKDLAVGASTLGIVALIGVTVIAGGSKKLN
jgi:hypothetical protein